MLVSLGQRKLNIFERFLTGSVIFIVASEVFIVCGNLRNLLYITVQLLSRSKLFKIKTQGSVNVT